MVEEKQKIRRRKEREGGVVGGFLLIFVGIVFLLISQGLVSQNIWFYLLQLWPILLILIGLQILLGQGAAARLLMGLVTIAVLLWALAAALAQVQSPLLGQLGLDKLPGLELFNNINWRHY